MADGLVRHSARIDGAVRTWCEAGAGPALPIVLLHGIGSSAASWRHQLRGLSGDRRVIAWNAPGYDASTPLEDPCPNADAYAAALEGLLAHLRVDRFVLLAHSLGAIMGARFLRRHGGRVPQLILSSPAQGYRCSRTEPLPPRLQDRIDDVRSLGSAGMAQKRAARLVSTAASPEVVAQAQEGMASVTAQGYEQAVWLLAQSDLPADLAGLALPTMFLCGTEDLATPIDGVRALAETVRDARFTRLVGAGHASYLEFPEAYNAAVIAVLTAEG